jgi:hypothetical protein
MPRVMQIVRTLVVTDSQRAIKAMELFDDLVKHAITVVVGYIKPLVEMFLEFGSNKTLDNGIRNFAVDFIGVLTQTKKKVGLLHCLAIFFIYHSSQVKTFNERSIPDCVCHCDLGLYQGTSVVHYKY